MSEPLRGPLASPGYWVHHAALAWRRELAVRLRPLDLTPTRFDVLAALSHLSKSSAPSQQDVADFAGIDRMMTSKLASTLEAEGLIVRIPDPNDARANLLSLTRAGSELVARATAVARAFDLELFGSAAERAQLIEPLSAMRARLEAGAPPSPR